MWSDVVVVLAPGIDRGASISKACEPVQVEAVLAELPVEALDERVLRRLAGLNEVDLHTGTPGPEEHRLRGQLGAVVANQNSRERPDLSEEFEFVSESLS